MSWVLSSIDGAFIVTPEGRILQGKWHNEVVRENLDEIPGDLQEQLLQLDVNDEDNRYEVLRELLQRGWAKGRWVPRSELDLGFWTDEGNAESVLALLPPKMLNVKKLYVEFYQDNSGYELPVAEGEDALDAYRGRGQKMNWRMAGRRDLYSWEELKVIVSDLGLDPMLLYRALGGTGDPNHHQAWEWLEQESDPAEITGFLIFEFGQDLPTPNRDRVYEEERETELAKTYTPERQELNRSREWMEVSDLPPLPKGTAPSPEERRLGIAIRQLGKGNFVAYDLWGWGFQSYGGRPKEALAEVYTRMGGKLPYHT
jgi:hypothetical protein